MNIIEVYSYIILFLLGILIGSFLNVCILRIPRGESIVTTPSHCMSCGKRLRWYELVPLLSWLVLRGKCSGCGARISVQYPLIEAANALLWLCCYAVYGMDWMTLICCAVSSALLALSVIDARTQEIPPGFNIFLLFPAAAATLLDLAHWPEHLIGFFAVSGLLYLIFLLSKGRAMGGGDIKLMAVCGLLLGWKLILLAFFIGCLLGSVIHICRMKFAGADRALALGPYLSAGVWLTLLWGRPLLELYLNFAGL